MLRSTAQATAREIAEAHARESAEKVARAYMNEELPALWAEYKAFTLGKEAIDDGDGYANEIADAQE